MAQRRRATSRPLNPVQDSTDLSDTYRRMTVRDAVNELLEPGEEAWDDDQNGYFRRHNALVLLQRGIRQAARLDNRPVTFDDVRVHLAASYARIGVTVRAPFATAVAVRLLEQQGDPE